ncbi:hypothetical protein NDU88_005649 [Pleurodeles waltl]|uniref:Uncharacterized protein n=1 Tax=Pleurodeles waltl TaxID=8319 RepID=A0AAV7PGB2_PLEWA|nr:hypothetical protein NDU88_005649 [Pleurodeles waltl]
MHLAKVMGAEEYSVEELAVVLLDTEKADEVIGWRYLFATFTTMKFGRQFQKLATLQARVKTNDYISPEWELQRGTLQVCPLPALTCIGGRVNGV